MPDTSRFPEVFARLKKRNPAPYGALINLGEKEYLVAASPEMYVRVDGERIVTVFGGIVLATAHIRNFLLCQQDDCDHQHDDVIAK